MDSLSFDRLPSKPDENLVMPGVYPVIKNDVIIGKNVKIGNRVTLQEGSRIGNNCIIGDNVITTGACWIGNNVNIRPGAIISQGVVIEDWVFIGPGVITNHTKHVDWGRKKKSPQYVTYIHLGSVIGSGVQILAGVDVKRYSIIGAGSLVTKDVGGHGIYMGSPCQFVKDLPDEYLIDSRHIPVAMNAMYRTKEVYATLKKYMPRLKSW